MLNLIPKAQSIKGKNDKLDLTKIKIYALQNLVKKIKDKLKTEKIFLKNIHDKVVVSRIHEELSVETIKKKSN